jgi:hypothetical protein
MGTQRQGCIQKRQRNAKYPLWAVFYIACMIAREAVSGPRASKRNQEVSRSETLDESASKLSLR